MLQTVLQRVYLMVHGMELEMVDLKVNLEPAKE